MRIYNSLFFALVANLVAVAIIFVVTADDDSISYLFIYVFITVCTCVKCRRNKEEIPGSKIEINNIGDCRRFLLREKLVFCFSYINVRYALRSKSIA